MNWRRVACVAGYHRFGLPLIDATDGKVARIYVRCTICQQASKGILTTPERAADFKRRLVLLKGRAQQMRMRITG